MARSSLGTRHAVDFARRPSRERGFTLIELMVVVMIVGILSILAVVGFRKLIGESRGAEAVYMVNAIKVAQESYRAETGSYANVSKTLCASATCDSLYPHKPANATLGDIKVGWGIACGSACNSVDWSMIPVHVTGGVMYGYSTIAGAAGGATTGITSVTWPTGYGVVPPNPSPSDWFAVTGVGDENMDSVPAVVFGSSFNNDLLVMNEGN